MAKMPGSNREKIIEVLLRHGLRPNEILVDGWDSRGYYAFQYGPDGKWLPTSVTGEALRERHEWPDDTVYGELYEAFYGE
jgi:hypothetical protein